MVARVHTAKRGPAGRTATRPGVQTSSAQQPGSPEAAAFLRDAELASERLSAVVRAVIFASLLALVMTTKVDHHHEHFALFTVAAYGVVAVVALVLAWRRIFHPALPYGYVTFDVVLVCLSVLLTTRMLDLPPHMAFTVPASALIFVVLAHASMRFRPKLVAYEGMLTGVLVAIGIALMPGQATLVPLSLELGHVDLLQSLLHSRILPFAIIALTTLILWATSRRTYEILQTSIDHSRRLAFTVLLAAAGGTPGESGLGRSSCRLAAALRHHVKAGRARLWTPVARQFLSGRVQGMEVLSLQPGWQRRRSIGSPGE
jgi:hypothetical protein